MSDSKEWETVYCCKVCRREGKKNPLHASLVGRKHIYKVCCKICGFKIETESDALDLSIESDK